MTLQRAFINGVNIAYRIDGTATRPWVVLINGLATDLRMWEKQIPLLIEQYRVLRYDVRGHGSSEASPGPYSFDLLVSDLIGLMDSLGLEQAQVVGLSLGGMTALGAALTHPGRISRVVCCDARADAPESYVASWIAKIATVRQNGMTAIVDETIARWFTEAGVRAAVNQSVLGLAREMILTTNVEGYCGCAAALTELNYLPLLHTLSVPAHFIVGSNDTAAPPSIMAAMASAAPSSYLDLIEGAAHMPNLEQPGTFNAVLARALKSHIVKNSKSIPELHE